MMEDGMRLWYKVGLAVLGVMALVLLSAMSGCWELLIAPAPVLTRDLKTVLAELKALQDEYKGKPMPEDVAANFETLAAEGKAIQDEVDRAARLVEMEKASRRVSAPTMPPTGEPEGTPAPAEKGAVAYLTLGDYVAASEQMREFRAANKPKMQWELMRLPDLHQRFVPLTQKELAALLESKAVPTLGSGVIEPTRVPELVRVTEHDQLTLRNVLDVQRTTSDAVKYTRLVNYTRAASAVAHSARKPEAAMALDSRTEPVRTIAVWMPVEEQQLDDLPALGGMISGELLYDVGKHVEELVCYGDGTGQNFLGILNDPAVQACRTVAGDTFIDIFRRGITDVRRAGYEPNAGLVDPLDWEVIVLEKGTDNRYVWVVVTEGATQRLWAVPVIETVAMEDFQGFATEERNMLIGDFRRGATLWDRMDNTISVGWINDQFIRNQRTLLAEMRAAFGVKRPGAFRKHRTQAPVAS
jgi:HK97 family phage major capsid protein